MVFILFKDKTYNFSLNSFNEYYLPFNIASHNQYLNLDKIINDTDG